MKPIHQVILLATSVTAALLGGCGSSGPSTPNPTPPAGSTSTPTVRRGSVKVTVQFPSTRSRAAGASSGASGTSGVPLGAQSVKIDITDSSTPGNPPLAQSQIVAAPTAPAPSSFAAASAHPTSRQVSPTATTASFDNIRAGAAHIHAAAYNTTDATGTAVGLADSDITVVAGQITAVTPVMTSTAASIQVTATPTDYMGNATGPPIPLMSGGTAPQVFTPNSAIYTATLFDSAGAELTGSPLVFSSGDSLILTVQTSNPNDATTAFDPAQATLRITGFGDSTAQIEVRDPNNGITFDFNQEVIPTF